MNPETLIRLLLAYAYAITPYAAFFLAIVKKREDLGIGRQLLIGTAGGTAAFCIVSTLTARVDTHIYARMHPVLLVLGIAILLAARVRASSNAATSWRLQRSNMAVIVLMMLALAVRLAPMLMGGESLGGDDARFHNILAQGIIENGMLPTTWEPAASIRVMYPRGTHVLVAFLATSADCEVHHAFNALLAISGMMTTGIIYLLASAAFNSRKSAIFAATTYGFIAYWGSLDYYRWGGLPNSLGMLFLCLLTLGILSNTQGSKVERSIKAAGAAVCFLAILLCHHYTLLVTILTLVAMFLFTANKSLRIATFMAAGLGAVVCTPFMINDYFKFSGGVGETSIFVFREPIIHIWTCAQEMNPILVLFFATAIFIANKRTWNFSQLAILSWLTALFVTFVALEYAYRFWTIIASHGTDCYTCLTPSRMATNMVYPMSILCGFIPLSPFWNRHTGACILSVVLSAIVTSIATVFVQSNVGVMPNVREAAAWIRNTTPLDAMIVGSLPHIEYLSWRETSLPPLPASEQREHNSVTWKRSMRAPASWLKWQETSGRSVYFLMPPHEGGPAGTDRVFSNQLVAIYSVQADDTVPVAAGSSEGTNESH